MVEGRDTGFRADWSQEATTRVDGAGTKSFVYVMVTATGKQGISEQARI